MKFLNHDIIESIKVPTSIGPLVGSVNFGNWLHVVTRELQKQWIGTISMYDIATGKVVPFSDALFPVRLVVEAPPPPGGVPIFPLNNIPGNGAPVQQVVEPLELPGGVHMVQPLVGPNPNQPQGQLPIPPQPAVGVQQLPPATVQVGAGAVAVEQQVVLVPNADGGEVEVIEQQVAAQPVVAQPVVVPVVIVTVVPVTTTIVMNMYI
jgi:hypothetical protein